MQDALDPSLEYLACSFVRVEVLVLAYPLQYVQDCAAITCEEVPLRDQRKAVSIAAISAVCIVASSKSYRLGRRLMTAGAAGSP